MKLSLPGTMVSNNLMGDIDIFYLREEIGSGNGAMVIDQTIIEFSSLDDGWVRELRYNWTTKQAWADGEEIEDHASFGLEVFPGCGAPKLSAWTFETLGAFILNMLINELTAIRDRKFT